jgi:hypothetical protein
VLGRESRLTVGPRNRERELPGQSTASIGVVEQSNESIVDPVLSETDLLSEFAHPSFVNRLAVVDPTRGQFLPPWQKVVIS